MSYAAISLLETGSYLASQVASMVAWVGTYDPEYDRNNPNSEDTFNSVSLAWVLLTDRL